MHVSLFGACTFLFPLISSTILAAQPAEAPTCVTLSGPNPGYEVETTTTTKTNEGTATQTINITPTITSTFEGVITTTTVSSTVVTTVTGSGSGGTFTSTITSTNTITETSTTVGASTTTTTTTVIYTPTVTASTVGGFIPVQSSLPGSTNEQSPANPPRRLSRRGKQCKAKSSNYQTLTSATNYDTPSTTSTSESTTSCALPDTYGQAYPSKVICETIVGSAVIVTVTSTADATTISGSVPTITETSTETVTSTSTIGGGSATSTITTSIIASTTTTTTITSGTTTIVTATESVNAPAATAAAACQNPANFASYYNGFSIQTAVGNDLELNLVQQPGTDYTSCCTSCQITANCAMFAFRPLDKVCFFFTASNSCTAPNQYSVTARYNRQLTTPLFVLGNGRCAQINSATDVTPTS